MSESNNASNSTGQRVTPEIAFEVLQKGGVVKSGGYTLLGTPDNPEADMYCSFGTFPGCLRNGPKHTLEFLQRYGVWQVMTLYDLVCDTGFKLDPWSCLPLSYAHWHIQNQLGYQLTWVYQTLQHEAIPQSILDDPDLNAAFWREQLNIEDVRVKSDCSELKVVI